MGGMIVGRIILVEVSVGGRGVQDIDGTMVSIGVKGMGVKGGG
jgi:hypothetical protein